MNDNLVSVIVPIYMVEDYLIECVDSIINQTYTNLQIILVDDGSPDGCGSICDKYVNQDSRIEVIHQKNGGLSNARNNGLKLARGKFVSFVDSDDRINRTMISDMVKIADREGVDVVCCDYTSSLDDFPDENSNFKVEILNQREAIENLLNPFGFRCFAWNKIYKRSLFKEIQYPDGKLFEDIMTTYRVLKKISKIAYIRKSEYFYRVRKDSISNLNFSYKNYDLIEAIDYVDEDCKENVPDAYMGLHLGYLTYNLWFINQTILCDYIDKRREEKIRKISRRCLLRLIFNKNIKISQKAELVLFCLSPATYRKLYRKYKL